MVEYSKIIAVSGLPGLYELISSKNDGAIIRSLEDKSTRFASSRIYNFSHLESIEIYTTGDNVNLVDIFNAMEKAGEALPNVKENDSIKKYFEKVYPELDFERVYSSDLKKMVKWFDVLKKNGIEIRLSELPEETEEAEPSITTEEEVVVVASPAKKSTNKKTTAEKPEAPAKKTTAKEKKEDSGKKVAKKTAEKEEKQKPEKTKTPAKAKKEAETRNTAKKSK